MILKQTQKQQENGAGAPESRKLSSSSSSSSGGRGGGDNLKYNRHSAGLSSQGGFSPASGPTRGSRRIREEESKPKRSSANLVFYNKEGVNRSANAVRRPLETSNKQRTHSESDDAKFPSSDGISLAPNGRHSKGFDGWGGSAISNLQNVLAHRRNDSDSRVGLLRRQHTDIAMARRSHLFGRSGNILGEIPASGGNPSKSNSGSCANSGEPILTNFVSVGDSMRGSLRRQSSLDSDLHLSSCSSLNSMPVPTSGPPDTPPFLHRRAPFSPPSPSQVLPQSVLVLWVLTYYWEDL